MRVGGGGRGAMEEEEEEEERRRRRKTCLPPQVVSMVLLNVIPKDQEPLNLVSKAKISPQEWGRGKRRGQKLRDTIMTESEVLYITVQTSTYIRAFYLFF